MIFYEKVGSAGKINDNLHGGTTGLLKQNWSSVNIQRTTSPTVWLSISQDVSITHRLSSLPATYDNSAPAIYSRKLAFSSSFTGTEGGRGHKGIVYQYRTYSEEWSQTSYNRTCFQVHNEVATLTARTMLVVEKTTPHAPSNVTVTRKETFAVTIEWLPGYSGCSHCDQTYKIRSEPLSTM